MPIFEYICKDCRKRFEALIYGSNEAKCPLCGSTNLDQQISVFAVGSGSAASSPCATSNCDMAGTGCGCACAHNH